MAKLCFTCAAKLCFQPHIPVAATIVWPLRIHTKVGALTQPSPDNHHSLCTFPRASTRRADALVHPVSSSHLNSVSVKPAAVQIFPRTHRFPRPLSVFTYSNQLQLWAVPFDLQNDRLVEDLSWTSELFGPLLQRA